MVSIVTLSRELTSFTADIIVSVILVPVSPSGTGKTLSSLIHSFFTSRFFAPARNMVFSIPASIVFTATTSSSLINNSYALNENIDALYFQTREFFYFIFYITDQIIRD